MQHTPSTILGALAAATAGVVAAIHDLGVLQDVMIGAAAGGLVARFIQRHRERRSGRELDARRIRQLDTIWITAGVVCALVYDVLAAVFS